MATLPSSRREGLAHWWQLRSRSERALLATGAALLALALAWLFVWQPLELDTERLTRQLASTAQPSPRRAGKPTRLPGSRGAPPQSPRPTPALHSKRYSHSRG